MLAQEQVTVKIKGLPKAFEGYRIGQISDIHWPERIDQAYVDRAIDALHEMKPDIICATGDFIDGNKGRPHVSIDGVFDRLSAPDGVLGVRGNHDHWISDDLSEDLKRGGIKLVENSHVVITRGQDKLAFAGIGDMWDGKVDIESALKGLDESVPRILLSHNPDFAEECPAGYRVDLQLSGHMHGGQVAMPFVRWAPKTVSKYGAKFLRGLVQGKAHRVYVSRGMALTGLRVRFMSMPEVTLIRLVGA